MLAAFEQWMRGADIAGWASSIGFKDTRIMPLVGSSAVIAYKWEPEAAAGDEKTFSIWISGAKSGDLTASRRF